MASIKNTLIGHEDIWTQITQVLDQGLLAHAYLFLGPQGVGKKLLALSLIQRALCPEKGCGTCGSCLKVQNFQHESFLFLEPDGQQFKISQAQEVHSFLNLQSTTPKRFVLINDAQKMNVQAANSLLKIIEEPPAGTHFILIATSGASVLPTIRSRAQAIFFAPLSKEEILKKEAVPEWILNSSQGRFDLIADLQTPEMNELRLSCFQALQNSDSLNLKQIFQDFKDLSKDREQTLLTVRYLQQILRDILFYSNGLTPIIHADQQEFLEQWKSIPEERIHSLFQSALRLESDIRANVDRILSFENWILEYTQ